MHELAITQNILSVVLDEARAAQAKKVTRIDLVIGELSGIEGDCVQFNFEYVKRGDIAEEAVLNFKIAPAQLRCRDCQADFSPSGIWICPECQSSRIEIVSGRDCFIESIEVD